ncbi:unnamed protein product [Lactuca saligna]|uniref:Uncharacterized protein n=1 Tax=Lactuca saligna TaxID=75948 RepID=A0AA36EI82_LACSI|nr:unnamed protein product [Lactuca saligna]
MKPQYENWSSKKIIGVKDEQKFDSIVAHLKRMLVCYIQEIGKMDVEITSVLHKKNKVHPKEHMNDLDRMKLGRIRKDDWSVGFQIRERAYANFHRVCFFLPNRNLYSTSCLEYILDFINQCKANSVEDQKCFSNMINWYILIRKTLLRMMPKNFNVQKHQPN